MLKVPEAEADEAVMMPLMLEEMDRGEQDNGGGGVVSSSGESRPLSGLHREPGDEPVRML